MSGPWCVWAMVCLGHGVSGPWCVWAMVCLGHGVSGPWCVWVMVCFAAAEQDVYGIHSDAGGCGCQFQFEFVATVQLQTKQASGEEFLMQRVALGVPSYNASSLDHFKQ